MTSEQKVKQVYPNACLSGTNSVFGFSWHVYSRPVGYYAELPAKTPIIELAVVHQRRKAWAWASAWRFIQAERKGKQA